jgi:hypothetical protein
MKRLLNLLLPALLAASACRPPAGSEALGDDAPPAINIVGYRIQRSADGDQVVLPVSNYACDGGFEAVLRKPAAGTGGLAQLELVAKSGPCTPIYTDRPVILTLAEVETIAGGSGFVFINKLSAN